MELISYKDWEKLVIELGGISWETGDKLPDSPYVFSTSEHIDNLFRDILENPNYNDCFVLVSAASDAGLSYQSECPAYPNIRRWALMDENINEQLGYHDHIIRARVDKARCLRRDRFCFKMYCWMSSTFPVIPKHVVRWFTTNCNVKEERVVPIPFGISPDTKEEVSKLIPYKEKFERNGKIVASWSNCTNERMYIKSSLDSSIFHTDSVPPSEYFLRLLNSKFCLCPEGNGLDSYRILEAIYLGCLPIIISNLEKPRWTSAYSMKIPVCRPQELGGVLRELENANVEVIPSLNCDLDYWKEIIQKC